jgi:hypothetical protein
VTQDDLPTLFEQQRDPAANEMAAFPARDWDAFAAHWTKIFGEASVIARAVLLNEHVAGYIASWGQGAKRLVGYWMGRDYWGKGVASTALAQFLNADPTRPIYAYVAKHNAASLRVLEKCGFTVCDEETASLGPPADEVEELVFILGRREGGPVGACPGQLERRPKTRGRSRLAESPEAREEGERARSDKGEEEIDPPAVKLPLGQAPADRGKPVQHEGRHRERLDCFVDAEGRHLVHHTAEDARVQDGVPAHELKQQQRDEKPRCRTVEAAPDGDAHAHESARPLAHDHSLPKGLSISA